MPRIKNLQWSYISCKSLHQLRLGQLCDGPAPSSTRQHFWSPIATELFTAHHVLLKSPSPLAIKRGPVSISGHWTASTALQLSLPVANEMTHILDCAAPGGQSLHQPGSLSKDPRPSADCRWTRKARNKALLCTATTKISGLIRYQHTMQPVLTKTLIYSSSPQPAFLL